MTAEEGPAEYKKLVIKQFAARSVGETAEGRYWRQFSAPALAKQVCVVLSLLWWWLMLHPCWRACCRDCMCSKRYNSSACACSSISCKPPCIHPYSSHTPLPPPPQIGAVSCIDFCPTAPHHFAVTASTRILLYDAAAQRVRRTFSRFKDVAFGGTFRTDGKLLAAGGLDGLVQVLDTNSRAVLRQLRGHKAASRAVRFANDAVHVLSGGDDATVRYWDVTSGAQVGRLDGHEDYVRAVAPSPSSAELWLTGGYDHCACVWDVRSGQRVGVVDHGAAVEAVAWLPSGACGGGVGVRVASRQIV